MGLILEKQEQNLFQELIFHVIRLWAFPKRFRVPVTDNTT